VNTYSAFGLRVHDIYAPIAEDSRLRAVEYVLKLEREVASTHNSNRGKGWHSEGIHAIDNVTNADLRNLLSSVVADVNQLYNGIHFQTAWININHYGDWNVPHVHPHADMAAVFYLDVPKALDPKESDGKLILISQTNSILDDGITAEFMPEVGRILLFPSNIPHMVAPHYTQENRISIALNFSLRFK